MSIRLLLGFAVCFISLTSGNAGDVDFFEAKIRPVLIRHCYECHSAESESTNGGLRVDTRDLIRQGGDSGPAVIPNDVERSLLLQAIKYDDCFYQMPPDQKLEESVISDFEKWIREGAVDPRVDGPNDVRPNAEDMEVPTDSHWAFVRPRKEPVNPADDFSEHDWSKNLVDRYVIEQLLANGLRPSKRADERTLIRRLYFDLIGWPPSYEQTQAFVSSNKTDKYATLVDELLASVQFGERWARHWLDVARFADTRGYVFTAEREYEDAFRYRDWVIKSFNTDLPFDEFIRLQIAADRMEESADDPNQLAAMGFLTLGRRFLNNRHDIIDDRIDVVTRGLMGLTVTCARCHDHKYDPIPTADYYSLYGVFASSTEPGGAPSPLRMTDRENPKDAHIFIRGNSSRPGDVVPRRFLRVLSSDTPPPFRDGSGRLELANCIADPGNPLTARVFVNRVWGHLFGKHLVDTPSDFGVRSEWPKQQKLLDALAVEFVESNWSIKSLIRTIVMSDTYRQASSQRSECIAIDPENRLLWKANRRRLDFEALRDALLTVAGDLDARQVGGPSAAITGESPSRRRALYAFIDRQNFPGLFRAFDVATPDAHSPRRFETTVPQQSLYLMNHPFVLDVARAAAGRALSDASVTSTRAVELVFAQVLGRHPTPAERELAIKHMLPSPDRLASEKSTDTELQIWSQLAHVLIMSNEFAFLD